MQGVSPIPHKSFRVINVAALLLGISYSAQHSAVRTLTLRAIPSSTSFCCDDMVMVMGFLR